MKKKKKKKDSYAISSKDEKRCSNIFTVYTWNGDSNKGSVSFSKWRKANRLTPTGSIAPFPRRGNYTGGYDSMIFYGMEKPTNGEIGFLVTYAHTVAPVRGESRCLQLARGLFLLRGRFAGERERWRDQNKLTFPPTSTIFFPRS